MSTELMDPITRLAKHTDCSPVMMIGHGSSGTSILGEILRDDFQIAFGTESQYFVHYYNRLSHYGDLSKPENMRQLIRHVLDERWFAKAERKWGFRIDEETVFAGIKKPTFRGLLDAIFWRFAEHLQMPRYGDKSPEYTLNLHVLGELYPDAKYIHMVRDGRDVAVSLFKRYWGGKNVYTVSRRWKMEVDLVDAFVKTLSPDQVIEITYEGLLGNPNREIDRLIDFFALDDADNAFREHMHRTIPEKLNRVNFDKWKTQLSSSQIHAFERVACETLRRHGFETTLEKESPSTGRGEQLFFALHNRLKKWAYLDYWKDNFYKAKLRLRNATRRFGFR
ncbi:MAG: sulfotransferase [Planctomycetota bacterium]